MSVENFAYWYFREHFDYWPDEDLEDESDEYQIFSNIFDMINKSIDSEDCYSIEKKEEILTKILSTFQKERKDLHAS